MSLRISAEDKEQIEEKARKNGLTTSEYIRRCALGRKLPCYGDTSLLKEYSMQLGKIGSNINQIAKHLNSGGSYFSVYSDVKEAVKELLDLKFKILPALEDVACGKKHRRMGYTEEKIKSIRYKMSLYDEFMEEYNCRKRNSNKIEKSKEISYRKDRGGKYLHKLSPVRIINRGRNDNGKWCYIFPAIDIFPADFVIAFFSFTVVIQMIPLPNHFLKIRNTSCRIFHSLQSNGLYITFQKSSVRMLIFTEVRQFLLFCMVYLSVIPALYIK